MDLEAASPKVGSCCNFSTGSVLCSNLFLYHVEDIIVQ
jgi:hypothetical protein